MLQWFAVVFGVFLSDDADLDAGCANVRGVSPLSYMLCQVVPFANSVQVDPVLLGSFM